MKENVLDVLMYLFENYFYDEPEEQPDLDPWNLKHPHETLCLQGLEAQHARPARVVLLRFFAGRLWRLRSLNIARWNDSRSRQHHNDRHECDSQHAECQSRQSRSRRPAGIEQCSHA